MLYKSNLPGCIFLNAEHVAKYFGGNFLPEVVVVEPQLPVYRNVVFVSGLPYVFHRVLHFNWGLGLYMLGVSVSFLYWGVGVN